MKKYLFFFLTICFSIGIIISELLIPATNLRIIFFLLIILLFISLLKSNNHQNSIPFLITSIILGYYIHQNYNQHKNIDLDSTSKIHLLKVAYSSNSTEKYTNYVAKDIQTNEQILLHIKPNQQPLYPNDEIIIFGEKKEIQEPLNPYQFDYKRFLNRKRIYSQVFADDIISIYKEGKGFQNWVSKSKVKIREKLTEQGYSLESRAIISSMLLGDRTELSQELNQSYIATGVVHILSISGLHVMMIYMILQFVLQPLLKLKNGRKIRIIISLIFIWVFAFYVELEPPVFRSALMITIYYISELLNRPKNIFHTLSLSAFIILVFQPNYLFDVGFQLSFSAVFFIVWLNPIFEHYWKVKNSFLKKIKIMIETSLSAQLGTLPISVLYFNQFSGLFLFGNLVLIPASFLMICGGIISILLIIFDLNIPIYTWIFNHFIYYSNQYIYWLASFKFIAKDVYISLFTAILIGVILYALKPLFLKKSKLALFVCLISLFLIQAERFYQVYQLNHSNELIVFNQYKNSIIGIRNQRSLSIFSENPLDEKTYNFTIKPYKIHERIKDVCFYSYDSNFKHQHFIKHPNTIETKSFKLLLNEEGSALPFYVLIHQSKLYPFENNENLKRVIADASNYPSILTELETSSDSVLWKTSQQGYFLIKF
ncbi:MULTISPECIES: ComEC/Rec2 family competence protein [Empedobacter]|uniref:ComEC family competence protein n=1 Tax=Empedobacter tilapiae TaxID=2491114 RepID=A0A4Z1C399_9FLAO|nr:ComEC/Rec2 family competence protein [Empedobacter tilapiae]TGN26791.1 ComEC family competence protein [Empedobacter tilapiae]